jgi:hypothetical protein
MFVLWDTPKTGAFDVKITLSAPANTLIVTGTTDTLVLSVSLDDTNWITLATTPAVSNSGLYKLDIPLLQAEGLVLRVTGGANTANLRAAFV